jgi:[ribosomal protein S5]-alanine N-acetyltransferase
MIDAQLVRDFFPIEGCRVRIDLFSKENITDSYLGWLNDPVIVRYSNQRFQLHTRNTSLAYLQSFEGTANLFLTINLKNDERYVGTMSAHISEAHKTADLGIMVGDKTCWGSGIGGDAWATLSSFLLDTVRVRKVTGGALSSNKGMVKIMLKSGMKPDGVRVAQELIDCQEQDILHFAKFLCD